MGAVVSLFPTHGDGAIKVDDIANELRQVAEGLAENGRVPKAKLFKALTTAASEHEHRRKSSLTTRDIKDILAKHGLLEDDPRIRQVIKSLNDSDGFVAAEDFEHIRSQSVLINHALSGELIVPDFEHLREELRDIYEEVLPNTGGENADYIPQLSEKYVNPEQFGVSVCTSDGQRYNIGDTDTRFGIQSCSKAVSYCIAQKLLGADKVHQHVGMEPSGRPFNELCLDERHHKADLQKKSTLSEEEAAKFKCRPAVPHNPMINAGAIMISSMLFPDLPIADRFDAVKEVWTDLIGWTEGSDEEDKPSFANSMYLSEAATAVRNFCLGYMMEEAGAFMENTDLKETLELYFMNCSLEMNCAMMASVAATLANGGVNPQTGKRIFENQVVKNALSLMTSCGMYDYSGQFAFSMGFPAKSGVGGGILIVIPGLMGLCTYSPRLDAIGNSVRGLAFCHALANRLNVHSFDNLATGDKMNPRRKHNVFSKAQLTHALLWAASEDNVRRAQEMLLVGCDVNGADYDGRTALHLAASCGHLGMAKYLVDNGADPTLQDRFDRTPLDDALREKHGDVASFLKRCTGVSGCDCAQFSALGCNGRTLQTEIILQAVEAAGVPRDDQRIVDAFQEYGKTLDTATFKQIFHTCDVIRNALTGELAIADFPQFKGIIEEIFEQCIDVEGARIGCKSIEQHADKWGVGICSIDGQRVLLGDTQTQFPIQAVSSTINYCIALAENGYEKVNCHIGREPSGRPPTEIILDERNDPPIPHNPFVNAGAIMSCALIGKDVGSPDARVQHVFKRYWNKLTGRRGSQSVHRGTYADEVIQGDRNRCLAYKMSEDKSFPAHINSLEALLENLDFYFQCCAIEQNVDALSIVAGTLANGGVCPVTGERVFEARDVRDCLSLMHSCGMYESSGEFAFKIGIPCKAGSSGVMMIVVPNKLGCCTWSPVLDTVGNSARGVAFSEQLASHFNFHVFDTWATLTGDKLDPTLHKGGDREKEVGTLIDAAAKGDVQHVVLMYNLHGADLMNSGDYDRRTALHLACAEGHLKLVQCMVKLGGLQLENEDRWGKTPLDEANDHGHFKVAAILDAAIADCRRQ